MCRSAVGFVLGLIVVAVASAASAPSPDAEARRLAPWLDAPAGWMRNVENGVVGVMPDDLAPGASLILLVEPPSSSSEALGETYDRVLQSFGSWRPVGVPMQDQLANGWVCRHGLGVATLGESKFTAHVAVAFQGGRQVRMRVLADSDATYNRYQGQILNAIASVQDIPAKGALAAAPPVATEPDRTSSGVPAGFGEGISGVYLGLERGASASAGVAPGGGTAPASFIADFEEVDVFYPDGTYRRRLPVRGLASDLAWERRQQPVLWGTWSRDGNRITVRRGSYLTTYTVDGAQLVSDRDRSWVRISTPKATSLEGSFARADYRDASAPRLVLHADGTYQDRGGFLRMIGSAWNLVVPDGDAMLGSWSQAQADRAMAGGGGTYIFEAFTLTLNDRDGRIWKINAYVPPGEGLPHPRRLVVNGRPLVRD